VWRQVLADDRVSPLRHGSRVRPPPVPHDRLRRLRSDGVTVRHVRVQATPEAVRLVQEQGGQLYVWAKRSHCCHGSLTFLETSSEPRERQFRRVDADGIELYLDQSLGNPEELVIEAKGRRRKHVHAYWDGCAYVV
jgi:hypothetical protein